MKQFLTLAFSMLSFHVIGRDYSGIKNELGVFCETNALDRNGNELTNTGGLVFKRAKSPIVMLTVLAGYTYTYDGYTDYRFPVKASADTMLWKSTSTNTNMVTLGFGTEVQRNFYRKLYLFAGVDIRFSYGTVLYDTAITAEITGSSKFTRIYTSYETYPREELVAMQAALVPCIGLKLALGRFNIGYSMANYLYAYRAERDGTITNVYQTIGIGNTHQRVFATYRF